MRQPFGVRRHDAAGMLQGVFWRSIVLSRDRSRDWKDRSQTSMMEGACVVRFFHGMEVWPCASGKAFVGRRAGSGSRRPPAPCRAGSKAWGPGTSASSAVDSSKARFQVLLANFCGTVLMEPMEVDSTGPALDGLVEHVRRQLERHGLKELVAAIGRTGRLHHPIRNVVRRHWTVTMIHPFATKQLRQPADPGNKTDATDLRAIVRATVVGYGTEEQELPEAWAAAAAPADPCAPVLQRLVGGERRLPDGPLVGHRTARLRDALLEMAHNLVRCTPCVRAGEALRPELTRRPQRPSVMTRGTGPHLLRAILPEVLRHLGVPVGPAPQRSQPPPTPHEPPRTPPGSVPATEGSQNPFRRLGKTLSKAWCSLGPSTPDRRFGVLSSFLPAWRSDDRNRERGVRLATRARTTSTNALVPGAQESLAVEKNLTSP